MSKSRFGLGLLAPALLMVSALIATPAAHATAFEGWRSVVAYVSPSHVLGIYEPPEHIGEEGRNSGGGGATVESGTSPSVAGERVASTSFSFDATYHGSDGNLWLNEVGGPSHSEGLGMAPGTNPSLVTWYEEAKPPAHKYSWAFQANTNALWTGRSNIGQVMLPGTSPSMLPNGDIAFQAYTGHLIIWLTALGSGVDTGLGMAPGTSPGITGLGSGAYEVAFRANTGILWTYCSCGTVINTGFGIEANTSPSIVDIGAKGWVVAFQGAGTHDLWTYTSAGASTDLGVKVYSTSSPSISLRAGISELWEIAFQTKSNELATYSRITGAAGSGQKMLANSSPSIAP
jgi:hypothetical protein